jgi:antitoxin component YwqK of YwqJK toxin-antitoxin module
MKSLILVAIQVLCTGMLCSQTLNDMGLYVADDGTLFNGTITAHKNGVRSDLQVKDGQVNGEAAYYYASGSLMEKGVFKGGQKHDQWTRFNEQGKISAIAFYELGKKNGTWLVFDDKGIKRMEMHYRDGEKTGIWISWNESGGITDTKDYGKVN